MFSAASRHESTRKTDRQPLPKLEQRHSQSLPATTDTPPPQPTKAERGGFDYPLLTQVFLLPEIVLKVFQINAFLKSYYFRLFPISSRLGAQLQGQNKDSHYQQAHSTPFYGMGVL